MVEFRKKSVSCLKLTDGQTDRPVTGSCQSVSLSSDGNESSFLFRLFTILFRLFTSVSL